MAVGKTHTAQALAKQLNCSFFDLDNEIEKNINLTIDQIIKINGEPTFRTLEKTTLIALISKIKNQKSNNDTDFCIISTGGGTPCFHNNMNTMLQSGLCIWLKSDIPSIIKNLSSSNIKRPILDNIPGNMLIKYITTHLNTRIPFYSKANITIDISNKTTEQITEQIIKTLNNNTHK